MGLMEIVGRRARPQTLRWDARDTMLYALAVGAGAEDSCRDLTLTTEVTGEGAPTALPTLLAALVHGAAVLPDGVELPLDRQLHAGQNLVLHGPVPASGEARLDLIVGEVLDKGYAALVSLDCQLTMAGEATPFATTRQTIHMRGMGGFGGPRGEGRRPVPPTGVADHRLEFTIPANLALLYRLTGDRNPLHCDPATAERAGFARPILHGLCSYGIACRLLLQAFGRPASALRSISASMTRPVTPGDKVAVEFWQMEAGRVVFRMINAQGEAVLNGGEAAFGAPGQSCALLDREGRNV